MGHPFTGEEYCAFPGTLSGHADAALRNIKIAASYSNCLAYSKPGREHDSYGQ